MRRPVDIVPTRRELALLTVLLLLLMIFTHDREYSTPVSLTHLGVVASSQKKEITFVLDRYPEERLSWSDSVPETKIVAHVPGWTILDRLYVMNGTLFVVTSTPHDIPERKLLTSSGYEIFNGPEERRKRLPSDKDIQIITPQEARRLFSCRAATRLDGVNFMITDPKQFIAHYYHWTAELLFGIWRAYSSLDSHITADGQTVLPPPRRLLFRHVSASKWRDYASMNQWVTRGAFPSIGMEFMEDWQDRAEMQVPFVFDRVVLADRAGACEGDPFKATWRTASNAFDLPGSMHWWAPLRRSVLEFSGCPVETIYGQDSDTAGGNEKIVITYISRQDWGRRMLRKEDHEKLVEELYKLRDIYGHEVNVVSMDRLTREEQMQLAGRTTIMLGVHGNGLTSLVWMRPTSLSTVIEIFIPGGVAFDYEYTTRALGMTHYGVWDNVTFTRPNVPSHPIYPDGFQGNDIPVDGKVVARLIRDRLELNTESGSESDFDSA